MEIFFVVIVIGIIVANVMKASSGVAATLTDKTMKDADSYDIPASLKAKWTAEDKQIARAIQHSRPPAAKPQARHQKTAKPEPRAILGQAARAWKESRQKDTDESRRQSRKDDHRSHEQRKAMAKLGDGTPLDKNPHRRNDWGHRGHFGGGWVTPIFVSLLSAAAVAALFAAT